MKRDRPEVRVWPEGRVWAFALLGLAWVACAGAQGSGPADRIHGSPSFLDGHPAVNPDGTLNVVVEVPAGTTAKWEVSKKDGALEWEQTPEGPRVVKYLGYPGSYGMVPRTILSDAMGGDGDPLDVLVLGNAIPRGTVVGVKPIGMLRLSDDGEKDDKILAVRTGTPLGEVDEIAELRERFPGVTEIVETWFANYKGPGRIEARGYADANEARALVEAAAAEFERTH